MLSRFTRSSLINKFSEYGTIAIPKDIFDAYLSSQGTNSVSYSEKRYTLPADVFNKGTHPENWKDWQVMGNPMSGFLYVRDRKQSILHATGTAGKTIFWAVYTWGN